MTHKLQWHDWTMIGGEVTERRAEVGPLCYSVMQEKETKWCAFVGEAFVKRTDTMAEASDACQSHLDSILSAVSQESEATEVDEGWVEVTKKPSEDVIATHDYQVATPGTSDWRAGGCCKWAT